MLAIFCSFVPNAVRRRVPLPPQIRTSTYSNLSLYRWGDREADLIAMTQALVTTSGPLLPEMKLGRLLIAAASSPFALQAQSLRLLHRIRASRNLAAHGQLRLLNEEEPKQQEQLIALYRELERVVVGVDQLEHDAKLEALMAVIGQTGTGGVVFFKLPETADYADQALRLNNVPSLRIERSASNQDLVSSEKSGMFLLAVDRELVGFDLRGFGTAINYDLPEGPRDLYARIARLAGDSPRVLTLIDQGHNSRSEEETQFQC